MNVPASGAVLGDEEIAAMHAQIDKRWLTAGPQNKAFEAALAKKWGVSHAITCNSGSSANLLAVAAMVESGRWKAGDEIITASVSFPTTINPLLLYGLTPVFVDCDIGTYNATYEGVREAIGPKTKGIMLAHTLGHPFPKSIRGLAMQHNLGMIEDCCDAFGAKWIRDDGGTTPVGAFSELSTCSFFPAHHMTTGEGGAVFTNDPNLARIVESLCSWGRDCYCDPGCDNTCGKRFDQQFGSLPHGYDHKYVSSYLGYNLKMTEIQAVCGLEQLKKIDGFIERRNANWQLLGTSLSTISNYVFLPTQEKWALPSWFGFAMTLATAGERTALQEYLSQNKIGSRLLFGGNITRQPYMTNRPYRISGSLENADKVMNDSLWIGCWPGLTKEMLAFMCDKIEGFFL